MYLKSLEIQGFKSFPDKTKLSFTNGITAIVGPNGSGKSNISDAMRWVLGEQSAKSLRGAKMEDVIFGGAEKRKPVGFAEVSLTIDNSDRGINSDYSEITVTRRYYRSGESEFFINRRAVRLKDVHELFMDTGLGRDGYSTIGQGRIDEILSVKSDDRRDFFEEAAGISKFRYRKEETERKLIAAEENLTRVRDILSELSSQVEPLREQSEKAKKYLDLRERLKNLEISCWLHSLEKIRADSVKTGADFRLVSEQLEASRAELSNLYAQSEKISDDMHCKDILIDNLRSELSETERELSSVRSEISVLESKIASNKENISRIEVELSEHGGRRGSLLRQIDEKRQKISELCKASAQIRGELDLACAGADKNSEHLSQICKLELEQSHKHELALSELSDLRAQLSAVDSAISETAQNLAQLDREISLKASQIDSERKKSEQIASNLVKSEQKRDEILNMRSGVILKSEARKNKASELLNKFNAAQEQNRALSQRISMLSEMERDYDGFSVAVKRIMKESESGFLKNIRGTVAQVITVAKEYTIALETAFGAALSNIITDTENDAKAAIAFLKNAQCGRATFLPLNTIKGSSLDKTELNHSTGFVGIASELCSYHSEYSQIIKNAVGRTAIADNLDNAVNIAKKFGYKFKIVTLDGQVVNAGGSMTGGSSSKNSGILSRAAELRAMRGEFEKSKLETASLRSSAEQAQRDVAALDDDLSIMNGELRAAEDEIIKLSAEQRQHNVFVESLSSSFDSLQSQKSQADLKTAQLIKRKNEILSQISHKEDVALKLADQQSELSEQRGKITQESEQLARTVSNLQSLLAQNDAQEKSLNDTLSELVRISDETSSDEQRKHELIEQYTRSNEKFQQEISQLCEKTNQIDLMISQKREQIQSESSFKISLEGQRVKYDEQCRDKNDQIMRLDRECTRLSSRAEQFLSEEQQIIDKMWENYEISELSAKEIKCQIDDFHKASKQIAEIKGNIKSLGNINVGAIDEYAQVSERYNFLTEQCHDLETSKAELLKLVSELSHHMEQVFAQQFALINSHFNSTFNEIFGGGSAELILTDPKEILSCGIEIRVALPGKSVKSISLLSGGEKAFVAIALYFAVLKVRPAPFCVLDEIEAALDDVNVDRYAKYMRSLCSSTQFIVITHRRGTMEESDILYGVTMQERGVSKLLALNITEVEQQLNFTPS